MKRYSIDEKRFLVQSIDDLIKSGKSRKQACKEMHTHDKTYESFKNTISKLENNDTNDIKNYTLDIKESNNDNSDINMPIKFNDMPIPDIKKIQLSKKKIRFLISLSEDRLNQLKIIALNKELSYPALAASYVAKMLDEEYK